MARTRTAKKPAARESSDGSRAAGESMASFVNRIHQAAAGYSSTGFLSQMGSALLDVAGCDAVELVVWKDGRLKRCRQVRSTGEDRNGLRSSIEEAPAPDDTHVAACESALERLFDSDGQPLPPVVWVDSEWVSVGGARRAAGVPAELGERFAPGRTAVLVPFHLCESDRGLSFFEYERRHRPSATEVGFLEAIARMLGLILEKRPIAADLGERIKELRCLHAIARIRAERNTSMDDKLERIVKALPPAWRYPDRVGASIEFDGKTFFAGSPGEGVPLQSAAVEVRGRKRGLVQVFYRSAEPTPAGGEPFLDEESALLDTVARELSLMIERTLGEEEEARTLEQLRHADRLATIGQLSAGVAHEINEPLSSILGFTQLIAKEPDLPDRVRRDLEKVEKAALRGREIVQNLLLFARQPSAPGRPVDLNRVVEDALTLLQPRLGGYQVHLALSASLPTIVGDSMQLSQVVVNLVTNALQSMRKGGRLSVRTMEAEQAICLLVEDTGGGMNDEVARGAFLPFFTTKEVGEGTGLGLSVVHGIVTSHGGTIQMESREGVGTRFEVRFVVPAETETAG